MNQNVLRVVKHQDFKKTVETLLGHPIRQEDVAVESIHDKPLSERVATINLTEMIFQMVTFNKDMKDVAVITQADLMREDTPNIEQSNGVKRKLGK